ncbi:MAG: hypothetical protein HQ491_05390 [Bacteroidetes bacterium]|nr:hypothetical protein [Bacteroidota bacterium]
MLFREYIEILWQAYLQDQKYLQTLREKIKSEEFNKDQMYDPAFEDWKSIDPRNAESHHGQRMKFHRNPYDPQDGVYVYEEKNARKNLEVVRRCMKRKRK